VFGGVPAVSLRHQAGSGRRCIVGSLGELLAGPVYGEEWVLAADLAWAKFDLDVVGHYSRPDVFRLEINEQPRKSVVFGGRQGDAGAERHTP
jgi:nitrilase